VDYIHHLKKSVPSHQPRTYENNSKLNEIFSIVFSISIVVVSFFMVDNVAQSWILFESGILKSYILLKPYF
jgi:hypothetical protein